MLNIINIAEKKIGLKNPCFIIAEAGVNHNGDITLAKRLIDAALNAGADAVKFQTFKADALVTFSAEKAEYQIKNTGTEESQYQMIKHLELSDQELQELFFYSQSIGIIFLSTPFDEGSVDLLDELGVPAFKIPSGEITNIPLLKKIAEKKKPIILSTGMATLGEVEESVVSLHQYGAKEIILLHCTTSYPAPINSVNLLAMETLHNAFKVPVGYSDHTQGITIPVAAVALGACVLEKHFTIDRNLPGPDHQSSLEPDELKAMVQAIRDVECAFGNGVKFPSKEEEIIKKVVRKSIVAISDINAGDFILPNHIAIKRPGTGIEPKNFKFLVGKRAKNVILKDQVIMWDMIE